MTTTLTNIRQPSASLLDLPYDSITLLDQSVLTDTVFWSDWLEKRLATNNAADLLKYLVSSGWKEPAVVLMDILTERGYDLGGLERTLLIVGTVEMIEYYLKARTLTLSSDSILSALLQNNEVVVCTVLPLFIPYIRAHSIESLLKWNTRYTDKKEQIIRLYVDSLDVDYIGSETYSRWICDYPQIASLRSRQRRVGLPDTICRPAI